VRRKAARIENAEKIITPLGGLFVSIFPDARPPRQNIAMQIEKFREVSERVQPKSASKGSTKTLQA
jgi:hypothetical protein